MEIFFWDWDSSCQSKHNLIDEVLKVLSYRVECESHRVSNDDRVRKHKLTIEFTLSCGAIVSLTHNCRISCERFSLNLNIVVTKNSFFSHLFRENALNLVLQEAAIQNIEITSQKVLTIRWKRLIKTNNHPPTLMNKFMTKTAKRVHQVK